MKNFGNRPDFAPDSGRKTTLGRTVRILPRIPDGNPLWAELSGFCLRFRMETHFGQNCPDFAPDSGWKPTLGRTVRILPLIPDGNPLRAELSGNNGKNWMESAWAAVPSGFICLNELYLPAFSSWLSGRPISS